ncbi:MAG: mucoidy inhibitor MuiA family protein [Myxococcales bacterium]|nr:mucoidy inhibitor MuiA family protein [Myxococcales bacterium]
MDAKSTNDEQGGNPQVVFDAPIDEVCLMEDRGRVSRRGSASLAPGRHRLHVAGVSPVLVDKSLVVASDGANASLKIVDARVIRELVLEGDEGAKNTELGRLREMVRTLKVASEVRGAETERIVQRFRGMNRAVQLGLQELVSDASWDRAATTEAFAQLETLREEAIEVLESKAPLDSEQKDSESEISQLEGQIYALRTPSQTSRAFIEIDVEVTAACDAKLQIGYSVPGACWRPAHRAQLVSEEEGHSVLFETDACVWQNTGEDWDDVQLVLSTERASLGVEPPTLSSDILRVQRKSQTVQIEAREQAVDELGQGGGGQGGGAPKLPGIDDGGTALNLRAPQRSRLLSDGRPHRIFLSTFESGAEVSLVAFPEIDPCVLLSATLENAGARPILAGPVDLIRDSGVVGRSKVLYVASGERFELGWGPEPELRMRRDIESTSETSKMLSSWRVKTHHTSIRVSNIGQRTHAIRVTERVPVSEIDRVKIEVDSAKTTGRQSADANGFVTWQLGVAPMAQETISLTYLVKKHEDVEG